VFLASFDLFSWWIGYRDFPVLGQKVSIAGSVVFGSCY
jgi:hypothetical protein